MDLEYSSFRDPSGQIFEKEGEIYRQINKCYAEHYKLLMDGGLYAVLVKAKAIVSHTEVTVPFFSDNGYKVIQPKRIPYISYPYEWCFDQLKDAALLTLKIHRKALDYGMILKDANAYNIQFVNGRPLLIDTLSFETYEEGTPWIAYGQFCRHFLAPLLLMRYVDIRLNRLLQNYIDGIPLDMAARVLKKRGGFFATQHIRWHAKSIEKHALDGAIQKSAKEIVISKTKQQLLINSLIRGIENLRLKSLRTEWKDYTVNTSYSPVAAGSKKVVVTSYLSDIRPSTVWDIGANDGTYSRLALEQGAEVVAFDIDPLAVNNSYLRARRNGEAMLPLQMDLTCPSPAIGFANKERKTMQERQAPDCIMALALIHHLAISNNLPFEKIVDWLAQQCRYLIIEFVPKQDPQVQVLLATRKDIFDRYTQKDFERALSEHFTIVKKEPVEDSQRIIYLCEYGK